MNTMQRIMVLLIANLLLLSVSFANKQTSSIAQCYTQAKTTLDLSRCADQEYFFYDKQLNNNYQKLTLLVPPDVKNKVIASQKAWLQFREKECDLVNVKTEGGTLHPLAQKGCFTKFNKKRINQLQKFIIAYKKN